jgi:hypothetical protein
MIGGAGEKGFHLAYPRFQRLRPGLVGRFLFGIVFLVAIMVGGRGNPGAEAQLLAGYSFGAENSWIRVQNIGQGEADVEVNYFNEQGNLAGKDTCPSTACPALFAGSGWTFFQRDNPALPAGFAGSAVVSTDQPVVALLAKDVFRAGSFSIAGDTVITGPGSHRLFLPVTAKRDGPAGDWNGRFAIQNMSDTVTACVTLTYLSNYTDDEVAWDPYRPPSTGKPQAALPGCPNGGMPLAPRGTIFRTPDSMVVTDRFTGSVRVDLHTNGSNQGPDRQFISATADSWNSNLSSFGSYRGFDEGELGTAIILPLVDRQVGPANSYSTRFTLVNKTPSRPARVTLRFDGFDLGNGGAAVSFSNSFDLKAARMCFQDRDDGANCLKDGEKLPWNFVGTARITSTEPLAAVVDRGTFLNETFTNYRGIRPQDGASRVLLPVLNKNYGPTGAANGWNSWFRVMVADGGSANVTVRYYGLDLPGGSVSYTRAVEREFTVFQFNEALPDGFAGTAIIEADRPIVALANLYTDVFSGDADLLYNGISLN